MAQTMKEIRKALLAADVDFKTAKVYQYGKRESAWTKGVNSCRARAIANKIMRDELAELMGSKQSEINLKAVLRLF